MQEMCQQRRELRTAELIKQNKDNDILMQEAAIEKSKHLNTSARGKYNIWRRDYENPNSDSTLKLMRDQILMTKACASIAKPKNELRLYDSLMKHIKDNQHAIGESSSDAELHQSALDQAKAMGHILSTAKDQLYDGALIARKLRAMLQSTEESIITLKRKSAFLIQLAAKTGSETTPLPPSSACNRDGKRVIMFSYGSGLSSTMFSFRMREGSHPFSLSNIATVMDVANKLESRHELIYVVEHGS